MYRCAACDVPAMYGHRSDCPAEDPVAFAQDQEHTQNPSSSSSEEEKINIASGEDVCFM